MSSFTTATTSPSLTVEAIEENLRARCGEISGTDSEDNIYDSIQALWKQELTTVEESGELQWYSHAAAYWESESNCPISDDGVLGISLPVFSPLWNNYMT